MRKIKKQLYLPIDLVDRLEEEENMSETAERALRRYFQETNDG